MIEAVVSWMNEKLGIRLFGENAMVALSVLILVIVFGGYLALKFF
ncbi:hypothetical protein [Sphingomicrobium clamense]|nr:hypothetical protein [Sphingomicrobium sp. B8]